MSQMTVESLDQWRTDALEEFTDHRIVDAAWLDVHIWFFMHMYADLVEIEAECCGYSFREDGTGWLLVLKVRKEGIRQVVFLTSTTPTDCMRRLRNELRNGSCRFYVDKYA